MNKFFLKIILVCVFLVPITYAQEAEGLLMDVVLDEFNNEEERSWTLDKDYIQPMTWQTELANNEIVKEEDAPILKYLTGVSPTYLQKKGIDTAIGIQANFSVPGNHVLRIYPVDENGEETYIALPGKAKAVRLFIWGANLDHSISLVLEDDAGVKYLIPGTSLKFYGWKKIDISIPEKIMRQFQLRFPTYMGMKLRSILIDFNNYEWDYNPEFTAFYYFSRLSFVSDLREIFPIYDGSTLVRDMNWLQSTWTEVAGNKLTLDPGMGRINEAPNNDNQGALNANG